LNHLSSVAEKDEGAYSMLIASKKLRKSDNLLKLPIQKIYFCLT